MLEDKYYTYLWLRDDGTPYYAGKGKGRRAYIRQSHRAFPPEDRSHIILQEFENEVDAYLAEKFLISFFGRKIDNSGCLRNLHEGGRRGGSRLGMTWNNEVCEKIRKSLLGHSVSEETRAKIRAARARQVTPRGYKWSLESRLRLSTSLKGKRNSRQTEFKPGLIPWNKRKTIAA